MEEQDLFVDEDGEELPPELLAELKELTEEEKKKKPKKPSYFG